MRLGWPCIAWPADDESWLACIEQRAAVRRPDGHQDIAMLCDVVGVLRLKLDSDHPREQGHPIWIRPASRRPADNFHAWMAAIYASETLLESLGFSRGVAKWPL